MLGFAAGKQRAWLHSEGVVQNEETLEDGWRLQILWTIRQEQLFHEV